MKKIIIIGTTGSGKSTLAQNLSKKLAIPHVQLDALIWKPKWELASDDEFFSKIQREISAPSWIIDGNYTRSTHLTWTHADTIIWIDLPFWLTFYQNFTRSFFRAFTQKEIWEGTGNRETFARMLSKDSVLRWLFKTYDANVVKYEKKMSDPCLSHVKFYRLRSRREIEKFLETI